MENYNLIKKQKIVSVVTVCWNAESMIRKTLDSVLEQDFDNYEYIIIDGDSKDSTLDIIYEYKDAFQKKNINFFILSEPDNGIYDAMNKALKYVTGKYTIYMNAGDCFLDKNILKDIFVEDLNKYDIIYGDIYLFENNMYKYIKAGNITDRGDRSPICHQAVFTKTELLQLYKFDLSYKLASDYDFLVKSYLEKKEFYYLNKAVSIFDFSGTSTKNSIGYLKEMHLIRLKFKFNSDVLFISIFRLRIFDLLRNIIKFSLKHIFYSSFRGWEKEPSL